MARPFLEVVETTAYLAMAKWAGMTRGEMTATVNAVAENPEAGDLIVGSGGCRKVRIAGRGKGKSGGYRVVTLFAHRAMPVYLLGALSKGDRENFTAAEIEALAAAAKQIIEHHRPRVVATRRT